MTGSATEEDVVPGWERGMDVDIQGLSDFLSAVQQPDVDLSNNDNTQLSFEGLGLELGSEWNLLEHAGLAPPSLSAGSSVGVFY